MQRVLCFRNVLVLSKWKDKYHTCWKCENVSESCQLFGCHQVGWHKVNRKKNAYQFCRRLSLTFKIEIGMGVVWWIHPSGSSYKVWKTRCVSKLLPWRYWQLHFIIIESQREKVRKMSTFSCSPGQITAPRCVLKLEVRSSGKACRIWR